ncbi:hypothetical protein [Lacticaseibacillus mingshuiensis]|uniref:Uncharacterized protein n=2 Tax=Lacticaseibacillus mingshuiensis TaxID=2799574 RepID=A0ABW4CMW8_9LACO
MFSQNFKAMLSGVITRGSTEVMIGKNMAIFQRDIQHLNVDTTRVEAFDSNLDFSGRFDDVWMPFDANVFSLEISIGDVADVTGTLANGSVIDPAKGSELLKRDANLRRRLVSEAQGFAKDDDKKKPVVLAAQRFANHQITFDEMQRAQLQFFGAPTHVPNDFKRNMTKRLADWQALVVDETASTIVQESVIQISEVDYENNVDSAKALVVDVQRAFSDPAYAHQMFLKWSQNKPE